jgi:cytochrome b561
MIMTTDNAHYPGGARLFHWLMAFVIILAWAIGFYSAYLRGDTPRGPIVALHKAIASTVIVMAAARLFYRYWARRSYPALVEGTSRTMAAAAHGAHFLLYAIAMVAAPVTGWYWSSVAGRPILMLGIVKLPPIAAANPAGLISPNGCISSRCGALERWSASRRPPTRRIEAQPDRPGQRPSANAGREERICRFLIGLVGCRTLTVSLLVSQLSFSW